MKQVPKELNVLSMVDELSGYDVTKHEYIFNMNYINCLNILWMRKIKNGVVEERQKMNSK